MNEGDHIRFQCINKKCHYSCYGYNDNSIYIKLDSFKDNIHFCPLCQHPLVNEIDVSVFSLLIETGITTQDLK